MLFSFFFNDTATTEIYTLSLHDALPIFLEVEDLVTTAVYRAIVPAGYRRRKNLNWYVRLLPPPIPGHVFTTPYIAVHPRSEEHTSELQSHSDLVCRLLLEKKKKKNKD